MGKYLNILAIDTSCDETAAAVTVGTKVLSNIIWSQAAAHAKFGGVMPSLAKRMHEERIDFVVDKAIQNSRLKIENLDAIAVTTGPGLSIALGVGVSKAKELAQKYNKPLLAVNHIESHLLSPLANRQIDVQFPAYGLVVSGGNTLLVLIKKIGKYEILAQTADDALGEALDKGARMLGLGYPGGAILEKMARLGNPKHFTLPVPLVGQEKRQFFSYSGLKTSFYRLIESQRQKDVRFPSKEQVYDLAASFQNIAFKHVERILEFRILNFEFKATTFLLGGGVSANIELRKRIRQLGKKYGLKVLIPYSNKLCGDNAAMIGVCAYLNPKFMDINKLDRDPRAKISA